MGCEGRGSQLTGIGAHRWQVCKVGRGVRGAVSSHPARSVSTATPETMALLFVASCPLCPWPECGGYTSFFALEHLGFGSEWQGDDETQLTASLHRGWGFTCVSSVSST